MELNLTQLVKISEPIKAHEIRWKSFEELHKLFGIRHEECRRLQKTKSPYFTIEEIAKILVNNKIVSSYAECNKGLAQCLNESGLNRQEEFGGIVFEKYVFSDGSAKYKPQCYAHDWEEEDARRVYTGSLFNRMKYLFSKN